MWTHTSDQAEEGQRGLKALACESQSRLLRMCLAFETYPGSHTDLPEGYYSLTDLPEVAPIAVHQ